MNATASTASTTLGPAVATRPSRSAGRGSKLPAAAAAVAPRPFSSSSSPMTTTLSRSSFGVVCSSLPPRRSNNTAPLSSPPRAARRQRPRSAEAAAVSAASPAVVTTTAAEAYAADRYRRRGPKVPGKGGGEEAEEEFSSPSSPSFSPPREKVGVALPLLFTDEPKAMELPRAVESPVDDPTLANPLQRLNRMSTGWMGVILECDGVTLPATPQLHDAAWLSVALAEGKEPPKRWQLRRADGMKGEQAVSEAFHWARAPVEVRRLARAKEAAFDAAEEAKKEDSEAAAAVTLLLPSSSPASKVSAAEEGETFSSSTAVAAPPTSSSSSDPKKKKIKARIFPVPGVTRFLETLAAHGVPAALASPEPLERLEKTLLAAGLERAFAAVVAGDDVARCRPDAEPYLLAAARLGRPPSRCVLIGSSNASVEAARDAGMAVVAVAPRSASDAARAATEAAAAAGADAETAASAGRAAAAAAEASAGGPRAYELGAADLVVRGGLEGITMADLKSLFANEAAVEGRMGGDGDGENGNASSSGDSFDDDLDSRASPWSDDSSAASAAAASASASDYGGLFEDSLDFDDNDDEEEENEDDADDDWRRRSRELQLRR